MVVADNGPGDGCAEMLETRFPLVKRVGFAGSNLGFGTAINRAVMAEGEGPVILLNDDAVPEADFIENLLAVHGASGAAMVAGILIRRGGGTVIDSAGIVSDRSLTAWDYLTGRPLAAAEGAPDPLGPTGGAALFDRTAFEQVGGFDERIFLYYEDLDLALRMRLAGHDCRLAAGATATHESSATLGRKSAEKYFQTGFSRGYLLRKYGIMRDPGLAAKVLVSDALAAGVQAVLDSTTAGAKGRISGWRAGADLEPLDLPLDRFEPVSLRRHMGARLARRRHPAR